MPKLSYMRYANSVLSYLNLEYECEDELDQSPEGVMEAKKFIKKCYETDMTFVDCCGLLVREVIRKNKKEETQDQDIPEGL